MCGFIPAVVVAAGLKCINTTVLRWIMEMVNWTPCRGLIFFIELVPIDSWQISQTFQYFRDDFHQLTGIELTWTSLPAYNTLTLTFKTLQLTWSLRDSLNVYVRNWGVHSNLPAFNTLQPTYLHLKHFNSYKCLATPLMSMSVIGKRPKTLEKCD